MPVGISTGEDRQVELARAVGAKDGAGLRGGATATDLNSRFGSLALVYRPD